MNPPTSAGGLFWVQVLIIGVGIDIADIERFRRSINELGEHFVNRVYTGGEIDYCRSKSDPYLFFASLFAVKESVMKALGYGLDDGASFREIEIAFARGIEVRLSGKALQKAKVLGVGRIMASCSCEKEVVIAAVILEGLGL